MHLNYILILASATSLGQARCYERIKAEDDGLHTKFANDAVDALCVDEGLSGNFTRFQTKSLCFLMLYEKREWHVVFSTQWSGEGNMTLSAKDCKAGLHAEKKCELGGSTTTAGWTYRLDPNLGPCP